MPERTHEQILDEMVHAVACVARHYGPGLNQSGLTHIRELLSQEHWFTDTCYRLDVLEDDPHVDFHHRILDDEFDTLRTGRISQ